MIDRPTTAELLAAARQFVESELIPTMADARLKFQTLIAANVLAIAERDLAMEAEHLALEWGWLAELLALAGTRPERIEVLREAVRTGNVQLCARIRQGWFDEAETFHALARQLRPAVERKLAVANPRYLATAVHGESRPS